MSERLSIALVEPAQAHRAIESAWRHVKPLLADTLVRCNGIRVQWGRA